MNIKNNNSLAANADSESLTIYSLDPKSNVLYDVIIESEGFDDDQQNQLLQGEFRLLDKALNAYGLKYTDLKGALSPPVKGRSEVVFIFDSGRQDYHAGYTLETFESIVPSLKKYNDSVMCIKFGDLIYDYHDWPLLMMLLRLHLNEPSRLTGPIEGTCYGIYFNSLTEKMISDMDAVFRGMGHYLGYADITKLSRLKTIVAHSLPIEVILCKGNAIYPESETPGTTNACTHRVLKDHYTTVLVPDGPYDFFLSYRIDSLIPDKHSTELMFAAVHPMRGSLSDIEDATDPRKEVYLKKAKAHLTQVFGEDYTIGTISSFIESLDFSHVYNVKFRSEFNAIDFDYCTSYGVEDGMPHEVVIGMQWKLDDGTMHLTTAY